MQNPLTIKELYRRCENQIKEGNGDKVIMISDDDEGNGFHYLWFNFSNAEDLGLTEDDIETRIASLKNTMILG